MIEPAAPHVYADAAAQELTDTRARLAAAEAVNAELVAKNAELSREAGRQDGVNEVLKDQLRKNQDTPPAPPVVLDQQPVIDAINQLGSSVNGKFDAVTDALNAVRDDVRAAAARPVVAPAPEHTVVHHTTNRRNFWSRWGRSVLISLLLFVILLVLGYWLWTMAVSRGMVEVPSQPDVPNTPLLPQDPTVCTVEGSIYIDILERCLLPPPVDGE